MSSLGERFRGAREARGLTLSEVAEQIRIRSVYLAAIEEENWAAIGAPVYARGFIRTYARFLGIDGEEAIASSPLLSQSIPTSGPPPEEETPDYQPGRPNTGSMLLWAAGIVALALIGLVVYNYFALNPGQPTVGASPGVITAATPTPVALVSASPSAGVSPLPGVSASPGSSPSPLASPPPGAGSLQIVVHTSSWIRVEMDGKIVLEGTFPAGTSRVLYGKKAVVRIGNAGGVELDVNGTPLGPLGKDGVVVDRTIPL